MKRKNFFLLLSLLLFLLTYFLFPAEADVRKGMAILVLVASLWLTEALPLSVTALLVPLLAVFTGILDVKKAFSSFSHPLIFLFFGGFVLATALSKYGIDRFVAYRIVSLSRGNFLLSSFLVMLATALISMWISNTSTTAMMLPLVLGMLSGLPEERKGRVLPFLLLGVAYSASVGGIGTLVGSPPNGIAADLLGLSFSDWIRFGLPVFLILFPLLFAVLFLLFRPPLDLRVSVPEDYTFRLTRERLLVGLVFLSAALSWIFGKKLSSLLGVGKYFDTVVAISAVVLLAALRLIDWEDIKEGVSWGTLLLFGGGLALSSIMTETRAAHFLSEQLISLLREVHPFLFLLGVVLFVIFLTEMMSNTATTALIAPILFSVAQGLGKPPEMLVIPAAVAASCAFMLPVATPPNAIVYGTGLIKQSLMMRTGIVLNLVFSFVLAVFFLLYAGR